MTCHHLSSLLKKNDDNLRLCMLPVLLHTVFPFGFLFSVFYCEVLESIRHGVTNRVAPENIILEINASKYVDHG